MSFTPYGPAHQPTAADALARRTRISPRSNSPQGYFDAAPALTPAGSDAAESEPRTNAEAGGVQFGAGRSSSPANNIGTGHAAGSTLEPAPSISAAIRDAADGVYRAGGVLPSSAAGIPDYNDAIRLHAARIIFGRS